MDCKKVDYLIEILKHINDQDGDNRKLVLEHLLIELGIKIAEKRR